MTVPVNMLRTYGITAYFIVWFTFAYAAPYSVSSCSAHEVYRECVNTCNDCNYKGHCIQYVCNPGCDCISGYYRNYQGTCIPEEQCYKPMCPVNEEYTECVNPCNDCEEFGRCQYYACFPGCDCVPGYYRNSYDVCVPRELCPSTHVCSKPNEVYHQCVPSCHNTCENYQSDVPCLMYCLPGCGCREGYVKNSHGNCVKPTDCPKPYCERPHEKYYDCIPPCQETCDSIHSFRTCHYFCTPGCACEEGYIKSQGGACIKPSECPARPAKQCAADEQFYDCMPDCKNTCANYFREDAVCPKKCQAGCFCQNGLVKNSQGHCVYPGSCEHVECKRDESFYPCMPTCTNTCESLTHGPYSCSLVCTAGCFCRHGLLKRNDGSCVMPENCFTDCGPDEEYYDCMPDCTNTCENVGRHDIACPQVCRNGCFCRDGLLKRIDGACVSPTECSPFPLLHGRSGSNLTDTAETEVPDDQVTSSPDGETETPDKSAEGTDDIFSRSLHKGSEASTVSNTKSNTTALNKTSSSKAPPTIKPARKKTVAPGAANRVTGKNRAVTKAPAKNGVPLHGEALLPTTSTDSLIELNSADGIGGRNLGTLPPVETPAGTKTLRPPSSNASVPSKPASPNASEPSKPAAPNATISQRNLLGGILGALPLSVPEIIEFDAENETAEPNNKTGEGINIELEANATVSGRNLDSILGNLPLGVLDIIEMDHSSNATELTPSNGTVSMRNLGGILGGITGNLPLNIIEADHANETDPFAGTNETASARSISGILGSLPLNALEIIEFDHANDSSLNSTDSDKGGVFNGSVSSRSLHELPKDNTKVDSSSPAGATGGPEFPVDVEFDIMDFLQKALGQIAGNLSATVSEVIKADLAKEKVGLVPPTDAPPKADCISNVKTDKILPINSLPTEAILQRSLDSTPGNAAVVSPGNISTKTANSSSPDNGNLKPGITQSSLQLVDPGKRNETTISRRSIGDRQVVNPFDVFQPAPNVTNVRLNDNSTEFVTSPDVTFVQPPAVLNNPAPSSQLNKTVGETAQETSSSPNVLQRNFAEEAELDDNVEATEPGFTDVDTEVPPEVHENTIAPTVRTLSLEQVSPGTEGPETDSPTDVNSVEDVSEPEPLLGTTDTTRLELTELNDNETVEGTEDDISENTLPSLEDSAATDGADATQSQ